MTKPIRFLRPLAAALLMAVLSLPAFAQFRWLDAEGKVHYGDSPPRDAKDVRALSTQAPPPAGSGGEPGAVTLPYELRRAVERAPVVLYTAPDCQPCAPAAALLRNRGVPFSERTVTTPDDVQELRRISGGLRLPYVSVGSQTQSGFNPDIWVSMLDAAGYPKGSMLPRSYQWPTAQPLVAPPKADDKPAAAEAKASAAAPADQPAPQPAARR